MARDEAIAAGFTLVEDCMFGAQRELIQELIKTSKSFRNLPIHCNRGSACALMRQVKREETVTIAIAGGYLRDHADTGPLGARASSLRDNDAEIWIGVLHCRFVWVFRYTL